VEARERVALISDIHGNAIALRETLRAIRRHGADEIVCLGDVATLGVAPAEVVDALQTLRCRCILGNHDEYLLSPALLREYTSSPMILEAIDWCRRQLSSDQLAFVAKFEEGFERELPGGHRLRLFHGSPGSSTTNLLADTPAHELDRHLGRERASVMAGGHTHLQMLRQHRGSLLVNPGSVGAPFREFCGGAAPAILDHAEYAVVEARGRDLAVTLHRVALDRSELLQAALASANPMRTALASVYL
jgi:predicted phosphodiesterase